MLSSRTSRNNDRVHTAAPYTREESAQLTIPYVKCAERRVIGKWSAVRIEGMIPTDEETMSAQSQSTATLEANHVHKNAATEITDDKWRVSITNMKMNPKMNMTIQRRCLM